MSKIYGPIIINLDTREDRLQEITKELSKLNLNFIRLSASVHINPAIGCIDSHCRVLEDFLKTDNDIVFVCEDDADFKCQRDELDKHIIQFIQSPADVLCLGFYAADPNEYSTLFLRSRDIQNRVSYIVKRNAAQELISVWRKLYVLLLTKGQTKPNNSYASLYNNLPIKNKGSDIYRGDQAWKICQQSLIFVIPKKHLVVQRESYSDIEKRVVCYGN